jgi:hypothetical protein
MTACETATTIQELAWTSLVWYTYVAKAVRSPDSWPALRRTLAYPTSLDSPDCAEQVSEKYLPSGALSPSLLGHAHAEPADGQCVYPVLAYSDHGF